MPGVHHDPEHDSVDLAINRVLEVERGACDQVERCRREAASILAAAEDESRRVARRAEHRIGVAHGIADAAVATVLQAMAERTPFDVTSEQGPDALLDRVVGILADEIIGIER